LAIVAHPDDEAWCAGLLAAQVDAGFDVHLGVCCNGNLGGPPDWDPEQRAQVRREEMEQAAGIIGCHLHWLDVGDDVFMDRFQGNYGALEWLVRDLIRATDPELLILPAPDDYHHHHRAVCELALNASVNASNPALKSTLPASSRVPLVLHMQPVPPGPFVPDVYVDISATLERKLAALQCHKSQHPFLQSHHKTDFMELVRTTARLHGAACEVAYAEAYAFCRRWNRVATIQQLAPFFPAPQGA
jgi:LmbE family N-acetylglucosaminyl deacetylase